MRTNVTYEGVVFTPKILPGPKQPSEVEQQHHMVDHLPPAACCELCVMGRRKDYPHLRSDLHEKGELLPVIAFDFAIVKTTYANGETEKKYHDSGCCGRRPVSREGHSPFGKLLTTLPLD